MPVLQGAVDGLSTSPDRAKNALALRILLALEACVTVGPDAKPDICGRARDGSFVAYGYYGLAMPMRNNQNLRAHIRPLPAQGVNQTSETVKTYIDSYNRMAEVLAQMYQLDR